MNYNIRKRILFSIYLIAGVFGAGSIGFYVLLKLPFIECLYLTVVMLTTVGFGDISPLSNMPPDGNKYLILSYTILLLIFGISTFLYAIGIVTEYIVSGEMIKSRRQVRMQQLIAKLENHFIICGGGETGYYIMNELLQTDRQFVLIEKSQERIDNLLNLIPNLHYITGDATADANFDKAGLSRAKGIILTLPDEKDNLFCVISLMQKKDSCKNQFTIAAKVTNWEKTSAKLESAGADIVICPHYISGKRMVSEMFRPSLTTFLDRMLRDKTAIMRVEEITLNAGCQLIGKKLSESHIRENTGLVIIAIRKSQTQDVIYVPEADLTLEQEDTLITIGDMEKIKLLRKIAGA